MPARISVIVPTLDESTALPTCLASLELQDRPFEITVVDGGSKDRTCDIARASGAQVVQSPKGRALQMNGGASRATGDILLFLHADSQLPDGALERIRQAVANGAQAGAFRLKFDRTGLEWRAAEALANVYSSVTLDLFGDRAIFVTRSAFDDLGGFRTLTLMEDLDLSVRLRQARFRVRLLPLTVMTSGRRFDSVGIVRGGWWAFKLCRAFHHSKALDERAARFYLDERS